MITTTTTITKAMVGFLLLFSFSNLFGCYGLQMNENLLREQINQIESYNINNSNNNEIGANGNLRKKALLREDFNINVKTNLFPKDYIEGVDYELIENVEYDPKIKDLLEDVNINNQLSNNFFGASKIWDAPYDEELAKRLFFYSESVYRKKPAICVKKFTKNFEILDIYRSVNVDNILRHGATSLIAIDNDINAIIVAFKGSSEIHDWINNFHMKNPLKFTNRCGSETYNHTGYIHRGHCEYYLENLENFGLKRELLDVMETYPDHEIIITGHSMGGSLALLFNADIYDTMGVKAQVYTFGGPRVGDWDFAQDIVKNKKAKSIYRIVSGMDVVPHLPPKIFKMTGSQTPHHPETEVWYPDPDSNPSEFKICSSPLGDGLACSNALKYFLKWNVKDHLKYFGLGRDVCDEADL